jgi:hypothetical protein
LDPLERFEELVERLMEGSFAHLFHAKLQPVEIAKRLEREMEDHRTAGPGRSYVPNQYEVRVNPADFASFREIQGGLERELAGYLVSVAEGHGYGLWGSVRVSLESDNSVIHHRVRIACLTKGDPDSGEPDGEVLDQTLAIPVGAVQARLSKGTWVVPVKGSQAGVRIALEQDTTRFGRGLDNDFVVEDERVSRNHAKIERIGGGFLLRDTGSRNGTFVNGKRVVEQQLVDGDRVSLGGWELGFHAQ